MFHPQSQLLFVAQARPIPASHLPNPWGMSRSQALATSLECAKMMADSHYSVLSDTVWASPYAVPATKTRSNFLNAQPYLPATSSLPEDKHAPSWPSFRHPSGAVKKVQNLPVPTYPSVPGALKYQYSNSSSSSSNSAYATSTSTYSGGSFKAQPVFAMAQRDASSTLALSAPVEEHIAQEAQSKYHSLTTRQYRLVDGRVSDYEVRVRCPVPVRPIQTIKNFAAMGWRAKRPPPIDTEYANRCCLDEYERERYEIVNTPSDDAAQSQVDPIREVVGIHSHREVIHAGPQLASRLAANVDMTDHPVSNPRHHAAVAATPQWYAAPSAALPHLQIRMRMDTLGHDGDAHTHHDDEPLNSLRGLHRNRFPLDESWAELEELPPLCLGKPG